ncbi:MAG: hypothetical protein FWG28_02775 [Clostridiales bacterium]|nr:hypothetical protein [Clostridiales bacterium]
MRELEQMLDLLEQKRVYFLHYEREMEELPLLPTEEMEDCLERGASLIKKIEELDGRLNRLVQQEGPMALSAVNHECDRGQLSPDLGKLFDASMGVKAVANRILQNDGLIRQRIAYEREQALEKIKEINNRSDSVAGKYQRYTQTGSAPMPGWQGKEV